MSAFRVDNSGVGVAVGITVAVDPTKVDLDAAQSVLTAAYAKAFAEMTERVEAA